MHGASSAARVTGLDLRFWVFIIQQRDPTRPLGHSSGGRVACELTAGPTAPCGSLANLMAVTLSPPGAQRRCR